MQKIITACATALALLPIMAGSASAQTREHQQMVAELRMLQEQSQQVALALAQLGEALKAINARFDASNQILVKGLADQKLVLDNVATSLSAVREGTQDTNSRIRMIAEELEALRTSLPSLLTQAPAAPVDPADPNAPVPAPVTAAAPPLPSTLGLSPNRLLESAKADYYAGSFPLAITGFEQFLKAFPTSASAGEAQFWIGEAYTAQNRWQDAVNAYNLVIQSYSSSKFVADAYFKRGSAQQRLGQADAAKASWETVIKMYRDSDVAPLAQSRLDQLSKSQVPQRPPG